MMPIKDLLNKIRWDKRYSPEDYKIYYFDRLKNNLVPVDYNSVIKIEGNFLIMKSDGKEVNIPLHRIRKVMKKRMVVWRRKSE